jgi:long-subunit acyl-CoA synthetase (AMP-forming)
MINESEKILDLMQLKSQTFGDHTALSIRRKDHWENCSYLELSGRTNLFSDYLRERGVQHGDRIAILGESSPAWVISFLAAVRAGAIIVPLDIRATSAEILSILNDAQPHLMIASDSVYAMTQSLAGAIPGLERCLYFNDLPNLRASKPLEGVDREMHETCLLAYTSGTTGTAKGVAISFGNIVFQVRILTEMIGLQRDERFLSILPLNHLLELTGGLFCVLYTGGEVCYGQSFYPQEIVSIMKEKPIQWMVTVPLFLKLLKLYLEKPVNDYPPI